MKGKITKVQKRDGSIVDFDQGKIKEAIFKALTATGQGDGKKAEKLAQRVVKILNRRFKPEEIPHVEQIQDIVEEVLILEGLVKTAKAYILYREQRRRIREAIRVSEEAVERLDQYLERLDWEVQENANMAFSLQGLNHYGVSYIVKKYWLNKIYPPEIREANESGDFHIHNLDTLAAYCMGWDLYDFLLKGFGGVPGKVESKPAKHFNTALMQAVNFLYTMQGECYSEDTQVLTENGWKYFYEVLPEEKVFTLNLKENKIELQKPYRFYKFEDRKELYHFRGSEIDLLVTPGHRMLVAENRLFSQEKNKLKFIEARAFNPSIHFLVWGDFSEKIAPKKVLKRIVLANGEEVFQIENEIKRVFEPIKWKLIKVENIKKVKYSGTVYCLEVPNHTLYVRRNGKATWSGNCAGAVSFSNVDTLLAPFIRYDNLNYQQVKQALQEFLFNLSIPTRVGFQSLAWEELVVIKHRGKVKFVEIGKLIDEEFEKNSHRIIEQHPQSWAIENYDDYYALSFNEKGKAVWAKIKAFIRHKVPKNSQFLKIRTNRGEAIVSPAHSLFSFEKFDNSFNPRPISALDVKIASDWRHLNPENHFLALSKFEDDGKKEELDLVDLIDEIPQLQKNVFVKINPTHTLSQIRENILNQYSSIHPFYIDFGIRDRGVWKDWLKRKSIRYDIWRKFGDTSQNVEFKLKNSEIWYPRILKEKNLENFVKICAWYIGEGYKGLSVPFYISQADLKNKTEIVSPLKNLNALGEIQKSKGYSQKGRKAKTVYKIAGKGLLCEIIALSAGVLSFNKVIPWYIFELSKDLEKKFIETLLKGEGAEYKDYWDFTTTSRKLSLSLSLLLAQNDIRFSVYTEKVSQKNKNWRDRLIIRVFKDKAYYGKKQYRVGDFEARVCLGKEKIKYEREFEYDISVDLPQENFAGGVGLLIFHNTPFTNITLDLKPSPTFAKLPVIIGGKPQEKTYSQFAEEMKIFNKALYDVYLEGDAKHRVFTFPIPTINITKDFPWEEPAFNGIFEASAKYGTNYFANYINSEMKPEDVRSMCCRLRLQLAELYNRGGGGLFGSGSLTGSLGVVTINLPRIGYLSKTKKEFFERLAKIMDLAKESLEIKRKVLENFIEKGLYPYSRYYLQGIKQMRGKYWANHFSTIGLVGMNEALLNFMGENIASKRGRKFALEVLDFMRERLVKYQEETGNIYNLEQTPAESTAYRVALKDKERYPDIITAGTKKVPFYTNSSQLPVNFTDDIFEALKLQEELTCKYTGGSVFHIFLGERMQSGEGVKKLVKKIFENFKLPYITVTPTFSICPVHSYIPGEHFFCPKCTIKQPCEVYTRIVGYYRPLSQFNVGKQLEARQRKMFKIPKKL